MASSADVQYCIYADIVSGGSENDQNYADGVYGWSLRSSLLKNKFFIYLCRIWFLYLLTLNIGSCADTLLFIKHFLLLCLLT